MIIKAHERVLFVGDSITQAQRKISDAYDLGQGHAFRFKNEFPEITVYNRGLNGEGVKDVSFRFLDDCLRLKPDVVVLLVGINDVWQGEHSLDFGTYKSKKLFEDEYRKLLNQIKKAKIKKVVLMEPFVLPYPKTRLLWRLDLNDKIEVVRSLAKEYKFELVPLDGLLNQAGIHYGFKEICEDGVHPTELGYDIIYKALLTHVGVEEKT